MTRIILAALIGLVVGVFIAPAFPYSWSGQMMGRNGAMSDNIMGGNQMDAHFIEQMIPHHEDAITMANLAKTKAEHDEIKSLSDDIIKAQSEEIMQMKKWYKDWFGKEPIAMDQGMMMHGGMMGDETDVTALETAKPFDKAFIEEMIPHHQMAVMMAEMLKNSTNRAEMRNLAENIISSQTREINQMRDWYKKWY